MTLQEIHAELSTYKAEDYCNQEKLLRILRMTSSEEYLRWHLKEKEGHSEYETMLKEQRKYNASSIAWLEKKLSQKLTTK